MPARTGPVRNRNAPWMIIPFFSYSAKKGAYIMKEWIAALGVMYEGSDMGIDQARWYFPRNVHSFSPLSHSVDKPVSAPSGKLTSMVQPMYHPTRNRANNVKPPRRARRFIVRYCHRYFSERVKEALITWVK